MSESDQTERTFGKSMWSQWVETYTNMPKPVIRDVIVSLTTVGRSVRVNYICPNDWVDSVYFYREKAGEPDAAYLVKVIPNAGANVPAEFYDEKGLTMYQKYAYRVKILQRVDWIF